MNFQDLAKIEIKDLKKIDPIQIKDGLQSHPDILLNVILIGVSIFAIISLFLGTMHQSSKIKENIVALKDKLDVLKEQEKITEETKVFLKQFPEFISSDQLVNKISEFALQRDVQILSFTPAEDKVEDYWSTDSVIFNVTTTNYANLVLFIKDIENSSYAMKIERWSGLLKEKMIRGQETATETSTEAIIKIQSIKLKDG